MVISHAHPCTTDHADRVVDKYPLDTSTMRNTTHILKETLTVVTMLTTFVNTIVEIATITRVRIVIVVLLACLLGVTLLIRE